MATLREAIKTKLTADVTFAALIPVARCKWRDEWGVNGLTASVAPAQTNGIMYMCAALVMGAFSEAEIAHYSKRGTVTLYVYHPSSYEACRTALDAARAALNNQSVQTTDYQYARLKWIQDSGEYVDDTLNNAAALFARFSVTHVIGLTVA